MPLRSRTDLSLQMYKSWVIYYEHEKPVRELYDLLKAYYLNNGLYDTLYNALYSVGAQTQDLRPLRNPAYRAVEFYAAKLWPGQLPDALKIVTENKALPDAIRQIWLWSNWVQMKQRAARWAGIYGDVFIKVEKPPDKDRVYLALIEPQHVTDFVVDERGYMTWLRLDIPQVGREENIRQEFIRTEIYDKETDSLRIWEHTQSPETGESGLGDPKDQYTLTERLKQNFIPVVQAKLRAIGEDRGLGAYTQSIDKIDEANRIGTRLHQMLWRYNKPVSALRANQVSPDGRPIPAPRIDKNSDSEIEMGGDMVFRLPGNSQLDPLIPNISWQDALMVLQDHMTELEHDLPELAYWRMREIGELSGRAVQLLLGDAIDKLLEARANLEAALIRADQMALSIGQAFGLFDNMGDYDKGDLDHTFEAREVIPTPESERSQTVSQYTGAGVAKESALQRAGWTEDQIADEKRLAKEEEKERQRAFEQNMLESERRFGQTGEADGSSDPSTSG